MPCLNKILVVRASGGLSNRLQAVLAGLAYCLLTGRSLCVDWRDGLYSDDFNNVFPEWFCVKGITTASCQEVHTRVTQGASLAPVFWQDWLPEAVAVEYLFPGNDHTLPQNVALSRADLSDFTREEEVLVYWDWDMTAALRLMPYLRQHFAAFSSLSDNQLAAHLLTHYLPVQQILAEEASTFLCQHFGGEAPVGIHIRYTDLQSPLDSMLHTLHSVAGKEKPFFLCTDNKHVEGMVRRLFPKVVTKTKIFQGDDIPLHCHVPGISNVQKGREALLDMLILARCSQIIHYAPSSFARIPALLSGLAPEYIHSVQ